MVNVLEAIVAYTLFATFFLLMAAACVGRYMGWSDPTAPSKYAVKAAALNKQDSLLDNENGEGNNDIELVVNDEGGASQPKSNIDETIKSGTSSRRVDSFGKEGEVAKVRSPSNESAQSNLSSVDDKEQRMNTNDDDVTSSESLIASPMKENEMTASLNGASSSTTTSSTTTIKQKAVEGNIYVPLEEEKEKSTPTPSSEPIDELGGADEVEPSQGSGGGSRQGNDNSSTVSTDSVMTTGTDGMKKKRSKPKARTKKTDSSKGTSLDQAQLVESI